MRSPFNIPALFVRSDHFFFLISIPTLLFAIVVYRINENDRRRLLDNRGKSEILESNLIFDRIKRKKFVSKGLRGKLRREIELDENEVVPSSSIASTVHQERTRALPV